MKKMKTDDTVGRIIRLPKELSVRRDASVLSLLQDSGYLVVHEFVTEGVIREALALNRALAKDWLEFSESKRVTSGWFLRKCGVGHYQVGYHPDHAPVDYSDEIAACAAFIKHEIEDIRTDRGAVSNNG